VVSLIPLNGEEIGIGFESTLRLVGDNTVMANLDFFSVLVDLASSELFF